MDHTAVGPPGRRAVAAVILAALIGAVALPVRPTGVGWFIALLAVAGALLAARSERPGVDGGGAGRPGMAPDRVTAAVAAAVLMAVPAVRAAVWLDRICVVAAVILASYALVGGSTGRQLARAAMALIPGAARGFAWFATIRSADSGDTRTGRRRTGRTVVAIGIGFALLAVFGSLFRASDATFAALTDEWLLHATPATWARAAVGFLIVGAAAVGTSYLARYPVPVADPTAPRAHRRRLALPEWVIPLAMLDALFAVFVWVQFTVLFGADEVVLAPGGPNYAVYARNGSAELVIVAVLTLGVFAVLTALAGRSSPIERGLLRVLGGGLGGLTLVIVVSALTRLGVYAGAYGLTVPRLLAYAGQVWLGLIMILVLVAGIRLRTAWLPRAVAAAGVAVLFALVAVNPEALMARTLLHRLDGQYDLDLSYVTTLSADAVDELAAVPPQRQSCLLSGLPAQLASPDPWYATNLSRIHARSVLARHPERTCRPRDG